MYSILDCLEVTTVRISKIDEAPNEGFSKLKQDEPPNPPARNKSTKKSETPGQGQSPSESISSHQSSTSLINGSESAKRSSTQGDDGALAKPFIGGKLCMF